MNATPAGSDTPPAAHEDPRWRAIRDRDRSADGRFVYAVVTTGVYCRPSCGARLPRPQNVRFLGGPDEARAAGFRPCKRCLPDDQSPPQRQAAAIAAACRMLEDSSAATPLAQVAARIGMSRYHFQRVFKSITGLTPKAYQQARRRDRMQVELQRERTVTDAIYEAGFNSTSRFYDQVGKVLGMTPSDYRNRGSGQRIRYTVAASALGPMLVAATDRGVCAIELSDEPAELVERLRRRFGNAQLSDGDAEFARMVAAVVDFVDQPSRGLDLPLDVKGTVFQHRVWQALQQIPLGETISYAQLALRVGQPQAVRAVARACASNPVALAVPCHRVVGSDGALRGYRWGVARKRALLERERDVRTGTSAAPSAALAALDTSE
ncbi:MAG TPA: bifunctional DNA-binding transcriptional regulator/O6-methylguanine-DNA methyltransferase Ada [Burkholderiaceae bacterium]|nr:bifunctional DNA-binding transcriptional regulator/O6-methylguanine-DNA methyltransferase Ada [Burkholderiaceae bacterium]